MRRVSVDGNGSATMRLCTGNGNGHVLAEVRWSYSDGVVDVGTWWHAHTYTHSRTHTYKRARIYSLNELLSVYTERRSQSRLSAFTFFGTLGLAVVLYVCCFLAGSVVFVLIVFAVVVASLASCLFLLSLLLLLLLFCTPFKLFRLFSCVMARLRAIFISSKWISHPLAA